MTSMVAIPRLSDNCAGLREGESIDTNGFTIGKEYPIIKKVGVIGDERLGLVRNDNGHERLVFLDGSPCAHITKQFANLDLFRCLRTQIVVGYFEVKK